MSHLHEIKQLISFFTIHFYYQKSMQDADNQLRDRC